MKRKEKGGEVDGAAHGQGQALTVNHNGKRKGERSSACHYCGEQGNWSLQMIRALLSRRAWSVNWAHDGLGSVQVVYDLLLPEEDNVLSLTGCHG